MLCGPSRFAWVLRGCVACPRSDKEQHQRARAPVHTRRPLLPHSRSRPRPRACVPREPCGSLRDRQARPPELAGPGTRRVGGLHRLRARSTGRALLLACAGAGGRRGPAPAPLGVSAAASAPHSHVDQGGPAVQRRGGDGGAARPPHLETAQCVQVRSLAASPPPEAPQPCLVHHAPACAAAPPIDSQQLCVCVFVRVAGRAWLVPGPALPFMPLAGAAEAPSSPAGRSLRAGAGSLV